MHTVSKSHPNSRKRNYSQQMTRRSHPQKI